MALSLYPYNKYVFLIFMLRRYFICIAFAVYAGKMGKQNRYIDRKARSIAACILDL